MVTCSHFIDISAIIFPNSYDTTFTISLISSPVISIHNTFLLTAFAIVNAFIFILSYFLSLLFLLRLPLSSGSRRAPSILRLSLILSVSEVSTFRCRCPFSGQTQMIICLYLRFSNVVSILIHIARGSYFNDCS